jgi:Tfp pilus assembly protein PilV
MIERLRSEEGFGIVELIVATVVLTVALLALMASYDEAFVSLHKSARTSSAATLAETQLELYGALPYASIGLSSSKLTTAKASDAYYSTDEATLTPTGTDVTNASCDTTSAQCLPVQASVKGSDGKNYRVETFVRDVTQTLTVGTTTERVVTVIVRDPNTSGTPSVYTVTAAFDQGPRS